MSGATDRIADSGSASNMIVRGTSSLVATKTALLLPIFLGFSCHGAPISAFSVTTSAPSQHRTLDVADHFNVRTKYGCAGGKTTSPQLQAVSQSGEVGASSVFPLPPSDETFDSPISALRELLAAPDLPEGADRYDRIGRETGGIWRSKRYGFVPCTVRR